MSSKKHRNKPQGWGTQPLGEVLGEVHGAKFAEIWNEHHGDMDAVQKAFRAYLQPFKAEFKVRGFDADFLSYAVPFHVTQRLKADAQKEAAEAALDVGEKIMRHGENPWN